MVTHTGHDGQSRRQVSRRLIDAQPADNVQVHVLVVEWHTQTAANDRGHQVQAIGVKDGNRLLIGGEEIDL